MEDGYILFWEQAKKELEALVFKQDFDMWIKRTDYKSFNSEKKIMTLKVPSNFIKDNIIRFKEDIEKILLKLSGEPFKVEFIVEQPVTLSNQEEENNINRERDEENKKSNKEIKETKKEGNNEDVYEDFSFDSFIIGSSNEFAAHAAKIVAQNPGIKYNPYLVWGESGVGKTHLLKAIEKYVKETFPSKKAKYLTSEDFTNDFVNSLRSQTQEQFRIKYRQLDVLIVDDIQFFANKENIQGELFHTFNKLYDDGKQMVFSCDQPISKIKKMEDRLKSRFEMGLTVDLRPPDFELRMAILKNLSESYGLEIDNDSMNYICSNITGNIRNLKGAFKDLFAYASIMKLEKITKDIVVYRLKEKITSSLFSTPISVDKIIHYVAEYYNLKSHDITGEKRNKSIALARQIAMYLSRKLTRLSTTQIGSYFGDKEHGTVMHATKKIDDLINSDLKIKKDIENITTNLKIDS